MRNFVTLISIVFLMFAAAACASSAPAAPLQSVETQAEPTPVASRADYQLGAQDQLRVNVFGEPDLSGEFVVATNGTVSLPLIGDIDVEGLTVNEFQSKMEEMLRDGYLLDPQVSAEVLNYRPFFILGEVNTPGQYPYANGLTVMNAIATAGGFTYRGNSREVAIKSPDEPGERRVRLTPDLTVQPGDTIRVLERLF